MIHRRLGLLHLGLHLELFEYELLVLGEAAVHDGDGAVLDDPQLLTDQLDETLVVRNQHDAALKKITLESSFERVRVSRSPCSYSALFPTLQPSRRPSG